MKRTALLLATLLATLSTGAMAQQSTGGTGTGTGTDATTGSGTQAGSPNADNADTTGNTRDRAGMSTGSDRDSQSFDVYDTNRDGSIDQDEARTGGLSRDYDTMDENSDRAVSRDEYDIWQQGRYYP